MEKTKLVALLSLSSVAAFAAVAAAADDQPPPPPPPPASSGAAAPAPEAQIAFADKNIWNWQVVDDQTVLIQDQGRRWYKATLFSHCIDLPFVQKIGFDSSPNGTFDKFSAILVRGKRCQLRSLVQTSAPPKKVKAKKPTSAPAP